MECFECLKGKSVFSGYLQNQPGGYFRENDISCYRTGDIGFIRDGFLYCQGRKDSQIKYKGYQIELHEIEYQINQWKEVRESIVVAKYNDEHVVKSIQAFLVLEEQEELSEFDAKERLSQVLPPYMIPKTIQIVDQLPITQNVKVDRKALEVL